MKISTTIMLGHNYSQSVSNLCQLNTCSAFNVSSMKICWSFSLTKLMQNCSNPFFWNKVHKKSFVWVVRASLANITQHCSKQHAEENKQGYLEDFKAIDIQHTNCEFIKILLHCFIHWLPEKSSRLMACKCTRVDPKYNQGKLNLW